MGRPVNRSQKGIQMQQPMGSPTQMLRLDVEINGETYCLTNIYNREGIKGLKKTIENRLEDNLEIKCIVLGDWNARVGVMGGRPVQADKYQQTTRNSMDQQINNEGVEMLELFDECGLIMLNGNKNGDWEGATTHVDYRSTSVIDYGAANYLAWEDIVDFRVGDRIKSDYFPLELILNATYTQEETETHRWIQLYSKENVIEYQRNLSAGKVSQCKEWGCLAKGMLEATVKKRVKAERRVNTWWNTGCHLARNDTKRALRHAR